MIWQVSLRSGEPIATENVQQCVSLVRPALHQRYSHPASVGQSKRGQREIPELQWETLHGVWCATKWQGVFTYIVWCSPYSNRTDRFRGELMMIVSWVVFYLCVDKWTRCLLCNEISNATANSFRYLDGSWMEIKISLFRTFGWTWS